MKKQIIFIGIGFVALVIIGFSTLSSIIFETEPPQLNAPALPTHWNLQDELSVHFDDESGIRDYRIQTILDGEVLSDEKEVILNQPKSIKITLPKPKSTLKNGTTIEYKIYVRDWSNANFFSGNTAQVSLALVIDAQAPTITPIAYSSQITRGGSAMVALQIQDMALDEVFINNGNDDFRLFKYLGEDIYVGIIAWPLKNKFFNAQIVAKDKAGNITKHNLPISRNINAPYYRSNIRIKENFLSGKLDELLAQIDKKLVRDFDNDVEKFVFFNETIRLEDEKRILRACSDLSSDKSYIDEEFQVFVPLRGSKVVGSFGDYRTYFLGNDKISEALHMGIDVASIKHDLIKSSNKGVVLLKSHLGLYGHTLLIYHGFGLSSLYSHMSEISVEVSDIVQSGQEIGRTGSSGWAFGDHLHFGILVQGHFVRLGEWLDQKWINDNIITILEKTRSFYHNTNAQSIR